MHGIKRRFAHALHADICQHEITVLYLILGMAAIDLHVAVVVDETIFAKDCANSGKPALEMMQSVIFFLMVIFWIDFSLILVYHALMILHYFSLVGYTILNHKTSNKHRYYTVLPK